MRNADHLMICPGVHPPQLTTEFWQNLTQSSAWQQSELTRIFGDRPLIPRPDISPYNPWQLIQSLKDMAMTPPALCIAFSAGVVGAMGAAWYWQQQGYQVSRLIAIDGWGVPKLGNFPVYRLSHDHFTHWSSAYLGASPEGFYADPAVEHLELWRSPQTTGGWWVKSGSQGEIRTYTTAAEVIVELLNQGLDR